MTTNISEEFKTGYKLGKQEAISDFAEKIQKFGKLRLYRSKSCQLLLRQIDKLIQQKGREIK